MIFEMILKGKNVMNEIIKILIERDGMSKEDAKKLLMILNGIIINNNK